MDETEHGLEPHRIIRLLGSLGAKESRPPLQVFMTTHSPVVLRELSGKQLFVVRRGDEKHEIIKVGTADGIQSTIRLYPDAFLAPSVLVGEGASEVGLMRGLDQFRTSEGEESISARGVALVDCGGGDADRCFSRGEVFRALGYRTAILRDDDTEPTEGVEAAFAAEGGTVITWRDGRALEDELFLSLSDQAVDQLIDRAIEPHGEGLGQRTYQIRVAAIRAEAEGDGISAKSRAILGQAARTRRAGWFKSLSWMEDVARDIVGPDLDNADPDFVALIDELFAWAGDGEKYASTSNSISFTVHPWTL
jgi:hypothetical protein